MKSSALFSLLLAIPVLSAGAGPQLDLGQLQGWSIVVAGDAIPSEKYAAEEFQGLLEQTVGIQLPIRATPPEAAHNIFIGPSPGLASSSVSIESGDLGDEGLRIRIGADNLAIAGGRPRGTLYGVYEFMERYVGVRFLTHDHTYLPKVRHQRIPCETWKYVPPFTFRGCSYKENRDHPEFAARLRINTVAPEEKLGGVTPQKLISHSFRRLLPVAKYGKEHPEYFALVNGERKLDVGGGGPEPCVSNPEVVEIVAQNVIQELDKNPGQKNFSVSQNDNAEYCRCEKCEAINQREGTPMGAHLAFVNAVAERVEKKHPGVKIGTLAYWYSRKPPKTIRPRHNVQIQLCSIECSTLQPLGDPKCAKNRPFCEDMNAWGSLCEDLWMWNYNTNFRFYDLPFPNLRVIGPNVEYFLKHRVKGVFMQANGNSDNGELCELRDYVIARCLWHPGLDSWELAKEFCRLHYGRAGPTMIACLTYLHDNARRSGFEPTCFPMPFEVGLNPKSADRIFSFFKKALARAEDETVRQRVEKASIAACRAVLEVSGDWELREGVLRVVYPPRYGDVVNNYVSLTKKYGQARAEEWQLIDHYYKILDRATREGYRAERLENAVWRLTVVADQGRMVELWHKPSHRDLLFPPGYRSVRRLFEYFTLNEVGEKGFDPDEPKEYAIRKEGSVLTLSKTLKSGASLQRRIEFDENDPAVIDCHTILTNHGTEARTFQLRINPQFNTGRVTQDNRVVSAYIRDRDWSVFNEGWHAGSGPKRSQLESARGGGYAFYNHEDGFGVALSFDPASVERPDFWWSDTYPQASLDLHTKLVSLQPGESFEFKYQIRFLSRPPGPAANAR